MAPCGAYDRNSRIQSVGLLPGGALLRQAAAAVELSDPTAPLTIVDYGCSTGRNSLGPMTARGAEMRPGARLVVVVPAADDDGTAGYRPMFDGPGPRCTDSSARD